MTCPAITGIVGLHAGIASIRCESVSFPCEAHLEARIQAFCSKFGSANTCITPFLWKIRMAACCGRGHT
eukprot:6434250-Karenia_brevis.AAC.1